MSHPGKTVLVDKKVNKTAMITACYFEAGDGFWVSGLLLMAVVKLSQRLADLGVQVVLAESMDNAQMADPVQGMATEAWLAQQFGAGHVFVLFRDDDLHQHNLFEAFKKLRELLPEKIKLTLVELVTLDQGLTLAEKVELKGLGCHCIHEKSIQRRGAF